MSIKLFVVLFGALLLVHCALSDSSEETNKDDSKDSSEEKITEDHLTRHVAKLYLKLVDQMTATTRKNFEPVINEVEANKATTNTNVQEKLTELKTVLEETNTKTTTTTDATEEKRTKNKVRKEIGHLLRDLEKIEDETTTPTEQDLSVRHAVETVKNDLHKNVETFVDRTIQEIEKYWKGLSTTEQEEKQKLHDALTEVKNESTTTKKLELLDKLFLISDDTVTNAVTW